MKSGGCPCEYVEPCKYSCTCASPVMSGGCDRCCKYGSKDQKMSQAKRLAKIVDNHSKLIEYRDAGKDSNEELTTDVFMNGHLIGTITHSDSGLWYLEYGKSAFWKKFNSMEDVYKYFEKKI